MVSDHLWERFVGTQGLGSLRGPAGASSLATGGRLVGRVDTVQCAVHGQFAEHDHLCDAQQGVTTGAFRTVREVQGHDVGRGQGFAGASP